MCARPEAAHRLAHRRPGATAASSESMSDAAGDPARLRLRTLSHHSDSLSPCADKLYGDQKAGMRVTPLTSCPLTPVPSSTLGMYVAPSGGCW